MPRWSVDIIRARAEHLGEVDAPDEQATINRAICIGLNQRHQAAIIS